ncbi:MAG: hypothetical protein LBJ59_02340 [Zoogloeaceae bacterium]|nr:hypothetical protein [Zoogloeaceae bacterium]
MTFRYSKPDNHWFLHKDGLEEVDGEENILTTKIHTRKDFGKLPFEQFEFDWVKFYPAVE